MALTFKIIEYTPHDEGVIVGFQGLSEGEIFLETAINFPKRFTREDIVEALTSTVEDTWNESQSEGADLSDLVDSEIFVDLDRRHPLYNATDPALAKVICEGVISQKFEKMIDQSGLVAKYGTVERDTWTQQLEAALEFQAGETVPFIDNAVDTEAGETGEQLAGKIIENASTFLNTFGIYVKAKRQLTNALGALPDDIAQIRAFYDTYIANWSM